MVSVSFASIMTLCSYCSKRNDANCFCNDSVEAPSFKDRRVFRCSYDMAVVLAIDKGTITAKDKLLVHLVRSL